MVDVLGFLAIAAASWLADDDYAVREAGSLVLAAVAPDWRLEVLATNDDAEVVRRVEGILDARRGAWLAASLARVRAALKADGYDAWPWIDSLNGDTTPDPFTVITPYLEVARWQGFSLTGPDFTAYREATRLWVTDQLWWMRERGGADGVDGVISLMRRLVEGDRKQCRERGYKWVGR